MRQPDQQLRNAVRAHLIDQVERVRGEGHVRRADRSPRWASVVAFALVLAVLLGAGITTALVVAARHGTSVPARTPRPTHRPASVVDQLVAAENQVVGTGEFRGHVRGTFTIRYFDGDSTLHLVTTSLEPKRARDIEVAVSPAAVGCGNGAAPNVGYLSDALAQDVPLSLIGGGMGDPGRFKDFSQWTTLAILPGEGGSAGNDPTIDCDRSTYSIAHIVWYLPAVIRNLGKQDRGVRAAARGPVELRDGRPIAYTVVADDLIEDVAARFGLTPDELVYLNPVRRAGSNPELYVGEHLNLDPLNRARTWRE